MVAMRERKSLSPSLRLPVLVIAGLLLVLPALAQDPPAPLEALRGQLRTAEAALLEADFEKAEAAAAEVQQALALIQPSDSSQAEARDQLLLETLDLVAQCRYTLGDKSGAEQVINRMIELDPSYQVSGEIVGPKFVELFESRRVKLVGHLKVSCSPLPCEEVLVDGRQVDSGAQGQVAVAAGQHRVVLSRHGFEDFVLEAVEVAAGDTVDVAGDLEQVARDVIISTSPSGAEISLNGEILGSTAPAQDASASEPFVIESLPPGSHRLILQAPCFQRYEIALEVVLDALDPGPMQFSTIVMEPSHAYLEIVWERPGGVVLVDGKPTAPGRHQLCPGVHEVALSLGGRRAWFESLTLGHEQTVKVEPQPRPSLALGFSGEMADDVVSSGAWNTLPLDPAVVEELLSARLNQVLGSVADGIPLYPERVIATDEALAGIVKSLAPDADLMAVWVEGQRGVRQVRILAMLDASRGLVEASSWLEDDATAREGLKTILRVPALTEIPFLGLDLVARRGGGPVVAAIHPRSALEGVEPGMILRSFAGQSVQSPGDLARLLAEKTPGEEVTLEVETAGQTRQVSVGLGSNVRVVTPSQYDGSFLLPVLARSESDRGTGIGTTKLSGALRAGMILAVLGRVREAATLLDGADLGEDVDPSEDARGTLWIVLEDLMGQLEDGQEYAAEVGARRKALRQARFGGRDGPALRFAD